MAHLKRFLLTGPIPLGILLSLAVAPDAARADPVTFSVQIQDIVRCQGELCDASLGVGDPFILTVSFDPTITRGAIKPHAPCSRVWPTDLLDGAAAAGSASAAYGLTPVHFGVREPVHGPAAALVPRCHGAA